MHIKAGYLSGYPIRCCICFETKTAGRIYDIDRVGIPDPMSDSFLASGPISICESCRKDFGAADFELEAPEMERRAKEREEEVGEANRTTWMHPSNHLTFPRRPR